MQAIGLCRFSYPAFGGFQVKHETIEDRIAYLYDSARLEERFRLFEAVALPSLRAQSDQNFGLVIVIGDQFPPEHEQRLEALIADLPQAILHKEPPRNQREVMKEVLNEARIYPDEPCLQFRFDDDDAIAVDFIEKLRDAAIKAAPFLKGHRSVAFDWNKGFNATFGPDGIRAAPLFRPFYVAALGMYLKPHTKRTIMNFAHDKIPRFMPALSFPDEAMFVRGINTSNDSRAAQDKDPTLEPLTAEQEALFRTRFAIDIDHVRRVFSAG